MAVRSKRLARGNSSPADTAHVVYTAPTGETVLLKDWHIFGAGTGATRAAIQVGSGGDFVSITDGALGSVETKSDQPWIVLQAGEQIRVFSSGGNFDYWISGAELEGVAD